MKSLLERWQQRRRAKLAAEISAPDEIDVARFAAVANAALFNPSDEEHVKAGMWRALHIADEIEQRLAARRERHPEHDQIVAEAMSHGWNAVRAGKWNLDELRALQARLLGSA